MNEGCRMTERTSWGRRTVLAAGVGLAAASRARPARATPAAMEEAMRAFTGGAPARPGRVKLAVPPLVDNGNAVALGVSVSSPMLPGDHVRRIAVFNAVCPPIVGSSASGRSFSMMRATKAGVIGST